VEDDIINIFSLHVQLRLEIQKKKNLVNKNQGWEQSIKNTKQIKTQVDTTQRKKQKQTINKKNQQHQAS
jgi:hypothetical protein